MKRLALLLLLIPIGLFLWLRGTPPSPMPLSSSDLGLMNMKAAACSYVATGTTKTLYRRKMVSMKFRFFHQQPNKCRIEYLSYPLKGVVVGSDGKQVWRLDPAIGREVAMEASGCTDPESRLDLLAQNYRMELTRGGRVAGFGTYTINVRDKSGRVQKRLQVNRKAFIILQSEDFSDGKLKAQSKFDTLKYVENPASLFEKPSGMMCTQGTGKTMSVGELSKAVGFLVKQPKYVPAGFKMEGYRLYQCPCGCGHKSAYLRYTNGMSSISVFETKKDSGCSMKGSCKAFGSCQMTTTSADGKSFIVIGDLDPKELSKIADSLH